MSATQRCGIALMLPGCAAFTGIVSHYGVDLSGVGYAHWTALGVVALGQLMFILGDNK